MAKNKTVTCNPENAGTKYTPPVSKIRLIKIRSKIIYDTTHADNLCIEKQLFD